ncbi:MAG: hypothetical protein ACREB2_10585, partial [Pseudolabrys sp.]
MTPAPDGGSAAQPGAVPKPGASAAMETGRAPIPSDGLGAPLVSAPPATRTPATVNMPAVDSRRSDSYYEVKGVIFGALIEA